MVVHILVSQYYLLEETDIRSAGSHNTKLMESLLRRLKPQFDQLLYDDRFDRFEQAEAQMPDRP